MKKVILFALLVSASNMSSAQNNKTPINQPPNWSKNVVWYEIFVERFYNADRSDDPKPVNINIPPINQIAPADWAITPWTSDWYASEHWFDPHKSFNENVLFRRYGGDLQGVLEKLDYLQNLGVTALFLNPINDAPSLHKYDARNYHHVDVNFGPDPEGDNKIIAGEKPNDPSTWQWTSADKLFLKLVEEVHRRHMKIILDYSWNHTGTTFWAFEDILKNQAKSPYKDWYAIKSFDDPATPGSEFAYDGWVGISSLPEIKKINVTTERKTGHPYEGDINPGAKKHIFDVTRRWLAPNGDSSKGIDGFRLDVADQIGLGFWRDFRKHVRSIKQDAYLVGEVWWEEFPDKLMNPAPYTQGDIFDAVMFYQAYRPARYFFAKTNFEIDATQFKDSLEFQWNRLKTGNRYAMMNVSSTADAPRLLTDFYNPNKYKLGVNPGEDPNYKTGKPDAEAYKRLQLYLVHLFTTIGAPQIFNGEEMGMWGAFDPDCRKPLWWPEYKFDHESRNNYQPGEKLYDPVGFNMDQFSFYKRLAGIRNDNPVLREGGIKFLKAEGKMLAYERFDKNNSMIVLFNLEDGDRDFEIPAGHQYTDLLTGFKITNKIKLSTLSAAVLKRVN
ncbi:MAG TPA: alpha-amylase family glycosyl hydrolase [Mucilaginibacter sp.]|nr:alpha-amylase family glycosyl hydrolase [Mucilaginibacter sp.]